MKRTILTVTLLVSLAGCASLQEFSDRHPVVTGIGVALIGGSIALAARNSGGDEEQAVTAVGDRRPGCRVQEDGGCR
jgi:hypothetical protein